MKSSKFNNHDQGAEQDQQLDQNIMLDQARDRDYQYRYSQPQPRKRPVSLPAYLPYNNFSEYPNHYQQLPKNSNESNNGDNNCNINDNGNNNNNNVNNNDNNPPMHSMPYRNLLYTPYGGSVFARDNTNMHDNENNNENGEQNQQNNQNLSNQVYLDQEIINKLTQLYQIDSKQMLIQKFVPLFQELQIKYNLQNVKDCIQLANIVGLILKYPSSSEADIHRKANQLGNLDIKERKQNIVVDNNLRKCICCDLKQQKQQISLFTDMDKVGKIGISTNLYFLTVLRLFFQLLLLFAIFSVFSIATNLMASNMYKNSFNNKQPQSIKVKTFQQVLATSIGSKNYFQSSFTKTTTQIQCWLGLVYVLIWIAYFIYMKRQQRIKEDQIDYEDVTIADYTLLFEKMPKRVSKQEIQRQLQDYQKLIRQKYPKLFPNNPQILFQDIEIQKINKTAPFYFNENIYNEPQLKAKNKQLDKCKEVFKNWIKQRKNSFNFQQSAEQRNQQYRIYQQLKHERLQAFTKFGNNLIQSVRSRNSSKQFLDVFVTFKKTQNKELLQRLHDRQRSFLFNTPCFKSRDYFKFTCENGNVIEPKIRAAPQPEDVQWISLSRTTKQIVCINIISFFVTALLFLLTFFLVFVLTLVQVHYTIESQKDSKDFTAHIIAMSASIVITVLNIVISLILNGLTKMERNESYTHEQNSIGLKTVIVTIINMILLPMVISISIKGNIYGIDGLAENVFNLAISNAFITPFVKFINPSYVINRVKYLWKNRVSSKLGLDQKQLNILNEKVNFQVGTYYAEVITLYLFTNFFASLQPLIVPISMVGLVLMYFASKYVFFKQCKRPVLGNNLINARMHQMIALGPLFYAIGSILWINFSSNHADILPNALTLILSILAALIPFRELARKMTKKQTIKYRSGTYQADKNSFTFEYDKLNPLTAKDVKEKQMIEKQSQILKVGKKPFKISISSSSDKLKMIEFFSGVESILNTSTNINAVYQKVIRQIAKNEEEKRSGKISNQVKSGNSSFRNQNYPRKKRYFLG